ncbi:MAG: MBOAT family protein [Deltaproteobacteria bacterium]|nr:MAG: MBOAT family protein [Deltaproteobacteria bacterium]
MLFPTFDFLLFALVVLPAAWALSQRPWARTLFLLGASYFFYMAGPKTEPPPAHPAYAGLLVFSTLLDFVCARAISTLRSAGASKQDVRVRLWLAASLVGNLGVLAYFKYVNFLVEATRDVLATFGIETAPFHLDVVLPLGISFYTFQSLSYTIDVYRGRLDPERSLVRFALFVVFFPQLVAGPIVRAADLLPQLRRGPRYSRAGMAEGAFRILKGLAKKIVLGDWIAVQLCDPIFDAPETYTSAELLLALYGYTLQIYADFSGYSDIAIGLGRLLGYRFPENFDRPYQARDIAEFWRRWHMTLSSWLRDYLYFPLRSAWTSPFGAYVALWLTMFLVGMWHGASWNFVVYSNLHAAAMVFNRWNRKRDRLRLARKPFVVVPPLVLAGLAWLAGRHVLDLPADLSLRLAAVVAVATAVVTALPQATRGPLAAVHVLLLLHFVVLSRIFFRAPNLDTASSFVAGLLACDGLGVRPGLVGPWVYAGLVFGFAYHLTPRRWVDEVAFGIFRRIPGPILGLLSAASFYGFMKLLEGAPKAFIYFQF